jgi:hypothetical protein
MFILIFVPSCSSHLGKCGDNHRSDHRYCILLTWTWYGSPLVESVRRLTRGWIRWRALSRLHLLHSPFFSHVLTLQLNRNDIRLRVLGFHTSEIQSRLTGIVSNGLGGMAGTASKRPTPCRRNLRALRRDEERDLHAVIQRLTIRTVRLGDVQEQGKCSVLCFS